MKKILLMAVLTIAFQVTKAQKVISITEVNKHVGDTVTVCDSVYSARALDNLSLLNLGGKYPKELLTVVVYKADRAKFEKEPADTYVNKRICITGKLVDYKGKLQIVAVAPKQIANQNKY